VPHMQLKQGRVMTRGSFDAGLVVNHDAFMAILCFGQGHIRITGPARKRHDATSPASHGMSRVDRLSQNRTQICPPSSEDSTACCLACFLQRQSRLVGAASEGTLSDPDYAAAAELNETKNRPHRCCCIAGLKASLGTGLAAASAYGRNLRRNSKIESTV
jgi:hypothetical protein